MTENILVRCNNAGKLSIAVVLHALIDNLHQGASAKLGHVDEENRPLEGNTRVLNMC